MRYAIILLVPLLAFLAACNVGGGQPRPTPTPSPAAARPSPTAEPAATPTAVPTPTVPPESGGIEGFRAFGRQIEAALNAGDAEFFVDRALTTEFVCEGEAELGPCAGKPAGTILRGIPGSVWQSDASAIFSMEEYTQSLERYFGAARGELSDGYGSGSLALYALGHKAREGEELFQAIAASIVDIYPTGSPIGSSEREAHMFNFVFQDGRWNFTGETVAVVSRTSADWLSGQCLSCYDEWERWQATTP